MESAPTHDHYSFAVSYGPYIVGGNNEGVKDAVSDHLEAHDTDGADQE